MDSNEEFYGDLPQVVKDADLKSDISDSAKTEDVNLKTDPAKMIEEVKPDEGPEEPPKNLLKVGPVSINDHKQEVSKKNLTEKLLFMIKLQSFEIFCEATWSLVVAKIYLHMNLVKNLGGRANFGQISLPMCEKWKCRQLVKKV